MRVHHRNQQTLFGEQHTIGYVAWAEFHKMVDRKVGRHMDEGAHCVEVKKIRRQEGCRAFKTQIGIKEVWHRHTAA